MPSFLRPPVMDFGVTRHVVGEQPVECDFAARRPLLLIRIFALGNRQVRICRGFAGVFDRKPGSHPLRVPAERDALRTPVDPAIDQK